VALTTFYGWTQAQLLAALVTAQSDFAKGSSIISAGSGDVNTAKDIQNRAQERIFELQHALHELDPVTWEAFGTAGHNQTVARFS
jgi:hypothetical protein